MMNTAPEAKLDANGQVYVETPNPHLATHQMIKTANGYDTVPVSPPGVGASGAPFVDVRTANNPFAGYVDLVAAEMRPSKTDYSETYEAGPFRFRSREISLNIRLADDDFTNHVVRELGLEEFAATRHDFSMFPDPAPAIRQAARSILANDSFRAESRELSIRADELVHERYNKVLLGLSPDSDDPQLWGGLVGWSLINRKIEEFPFSPENVRKLTLRTKLDLYERILALSRSGISDARFRRANPA